jgi:hypothetical protein
MHSRLPERVRAKDTRSLARDGGWATAKSLHRNRRPGKGRCTLRKERGIKS